MTWLLMDAVRRQRMFREATPCAECAPRLTMQNLDLPPAVTCTSCGFTWRWITTGWDGYWETGHWKAVARQDPPSAADTPISPQAVEDACIVMHNAYEAAAVREGWETQERSRKRWEDVPEANKATMRAAVTALLEHLEARR